MPAGKSKGRIRRVSQHYPEFKASEAETALEKGFRILARMIARRLIKEKRKPDEFTSLDSDKTDKKASGEKLFGKGQV